MPSDVTSAHLSRHRADACMMQAIIACMHHRVLVQDRTQFMRYHTPTSSKSTFLYMLYLALFLLASLLSASALFAQNRFPVLFDSTNHLHRDIQYHPEQPERIKVCIQALKHYKTANDKSRIHLIDVAADTRVIQMLECPMNHLHHKN